MNLDNYNLTKESLLKNLKDYREHAKEVNDFISKEISQKHRKKTSFLAGTFENFNPDTHGNKFDLVKMTIFGELMSQVIDNNPNLKIQLLTQYRSQVNRKIRQIEISIDNLKKEAIKFLLENP